MATITPRLQVSDTKGQRVVSLDNRCFASVAATKASCKSSARKSRASTPRSSETAGAVAASRPKLALRNVRQRQADHRASAHPRRPDSSRSQRRGGRVPDRPGTAPFHGAQTSAIVDFDGHRFSTTCARWVRRVLDEVLALVMDSAIEVTGAERGFIMLAAPGSQLEFKIGRASGRMPLSGRLFDTSQKIPQQVFATGQEMIVADLMDGSYAGQHLGTVALGIRHVLYNPPRGPVTSIGWKPRPLAADRRAVSRQPRGRLLSTMTRHALDAFATEAAAAIESARCAAKRPKGGSSASSNWRRRYSAPCCRRR